MKKENFDISKYDNSSTYIPYIQIYNNKIVKKDSLLPFILNGKQNQVLHGDILITISSEKKDELGFSSIYLDDFCCYLNSFCFGIRLKNEFRNSIYQEYINIYFSSYNFRKKMFNISQGSTRYNLPKTDFLKFSILIPSINEQIKISKFFSLLDKHIELWERKLQLCLLKKKYYLNKLFFSNTHLSFLRFKEFCDGVKFEENLLYSISKLKKGEQINNSDLSKNGKYYYQNGGINPSGFLDNYNEHEDTISISEGGESCGFCKWNDKKFWAGGHLFTVKVFDPKIDNKYLYFYLKSKEKQIMRLRVGGALPNIQKSDLEKIKVVNPGILEQMKISKFLSLLDKEIELLEKNISYLKNKKKFYISNMFI